MFSEQWEKWEPIKDLPTKVLLQDFGFDDEGLFTKVFSRQDDKHIVKVLFDGYIMSYRDTDESSMQKTINMIIEEYGEDFLNWSFFKVKNSDYLKWLHEQTYNIYIDMDVQHFVIATCDEFIEILATYEPTVTMYNN
jgi:hypothetical protein